MKRIGQILSGLLMLVGAAFALWWWYGRSEKDEIKAREESRKGHVESAKKHDQRRQKHEQRSLAAEKRAKRAIEKLKGNDDDSDDDGGDIGEWYDGMRRGDS